MTFHCLFEQSGTFKNEFKKLGFDAIDYDISDSYGQTDVQIDLFAEIEKAYDGQASIFDRITPDDMVLAFFPCTRFEEQIQLSFRGQAHQFAKWTDEQKIEYAMKLHKELHELYILFAKMCLVCIRGGLRTVIENPYHKQHYLRKYFPIPATMIDENRWMKGDYFVKPTQYWFINFKPASNLLFEAVELKKKKKASWGTIPGGAVSKGKQRSEIAPEYANRFIREFLIEKDAPQPDKPDASNGDMDDSMPTLF